MKMNTIKISKLYIEKKKKNKSLNNIQSLLIIIFIILLLNIIISKSLIIKNNTKGLYLIRNKTNKEKYSYYFNTNLSVIVKNYSMIDIFPETLSQYIDYMDKARNGILFNKSNLIKSENPKVSVVISLYNREDFVNSTIRSVQNQNITDLEIIIVDDCSTDNSLKYSKELQKNDSRIVILENKINMGSLYSKSIGVLNARGKYVHSLDSDDMFSAEDYLDTIYKEAIQGDYDYIDCEAIYIDERGSTVTRRRPFWVVLWSKLVKTKKYQNTIYQIGKEILENKVVILDDDIIAFYLFRGKRKILSKIGPCHFTHFGNHVYFSQLENKKNYETYCKNMINTIEALYKMKLQSGKQHGINLLHLIIGRGCMKYSNSSKIEKILLQIKNQTQNHSTNISKIL